MKKRIIDSIGGNLSPDERRNLRLEVEEFNTEYARALDSGEIERWPDFFSEDGFYRITARENFDENLPVGLVWLDGKPMIKDRVIAIQNTMVFAPRYLRHINGNVQILGVDNDLHVIAESNYLVVETLMEDESKIALVGCYRDCFIRDKENLLIKSRDCIYDSLLIANDLVYPV